MITNNANTDLQNERAQLEERLRESRNRIQHDVQDLKASIRPVTLVWKAADWMAEKFKDPEDRTTATLQMVVSRVLVRRFPQSSLVSLAVSTLLPVLFRNLPQLVELSKQAMSPEGKVEILGKMRRSVSALRRTIRPAPGR